MYEIIAQELVEPKAEKRFIGTRARCRFCGVEDQSAFGRRTNAHTFPEALGNKILFSLDECKSCNGKFSIYEDSLCKAIGPFLTLGGVKGKKRIRQTGRSNSNCVIRHSDQDDRRYLQMRTQGPTDNVLGTVPGTDVIQLRMPVQGDKFIPLYAYKALAKIGISLLPEDELHRFRGIIECLQIKDTAPASRIPRVGFSYSYVGNAPPALAGRLVRRKAEKAQVPYMIAIFLAGSVCFQIWLRSDDKDEHVPKDVKLGIRWTSQLPKPEGGFLPIEYSDPLQFDWYSVEPQLQPFEAFNLKFNTISTEGVLEPILRMK